MDIIYDFQRPVTEKFFKNIMFWQKYLRVKNTKTILLLVKHIFLSWRCICLRDNDADSIDVAAPLSHYWWKMSPMLSNMSYKCIFHQIGQTVVCFEMLNTWIGSEFNSNDFWWFFQLSSQPTPLQTIEDKQTKNGKPGEKFQKNLNKSFS